MEKYIIILLYEMGIVKEVRDECVAMHKYSGHIAPSNTIFSLLVDLQTKWPSEWRFDSAQILKKQARLPSREDLSQQCKPPPRQMCL